MMRLFASLLVVAGVLALASCSSDRTGAIPTLDAASSTGPFTGRANTRARLVYVADEARSFIAIFDRDGTQVGTITKGLKYPTGLFVDGAHNLWVANQGAPNVVEFARGASTPRLRYTGPMHHRSGTLDYAGAQYTGITCDAAGNVFATGVVGTLGTVIVFPNGQNSGAYLWPISSPGNLGGIKPDNAGNILVGYPPGTVTEYTEAGKPTGVAVKAVGWIDFALSRDGKVLLGGDQSLNEGVSVTFPGGVTRVHYKSKFSKVLGVAFDSSQKGL